MSFISQLIPRRLRFREAELPKDWRPLVDRNEHQDDRLMVFAVLLHNADVRYRTMVILLALSMAANAFYLVTNKFIPYVVAIDELGQTVTFWPTSKAKPANLERVDKMEIENWLGYARGLSTDNLYEKKMIRYAESRVCPGSAAARVFKEFKDERMPFDTNKLSSFDVEIKADQPQSVSNGLNTWYAEWIERQRNLSGEVMSSNRYKGILTFVHEPANTKEDLDSNPFGFCLKDISWSVMR